MYVADKIPYIDRKYIDLFLLWHLVDTRIWAASKQH